MQKTMNTKDIRKKSMTELDKELREKAGALNDFRFGISSGKIKNTKTGKNLRKEIAQILTVMKEMKKA